MKLGIFLLLALLLPLRLFACSSDTIKAPESDKQFDDPDDPGQGGTVGAKDATTVEPDVVDTGPPPPPDTGADAAVDAPLDGAAD